MSAQPTTYSEMLDDELWMARSDAIRQACDLNCDLQHVPNVLASSVRDEIRELRSQIEAMEAEMRARGDEVVAFEE